jgi:hypothetical protein
VGAAACRRYRGCAPVGFLLLLLLGWGRDSLFDFAHFGFDFKLGLLIEYAHFDGLKGRC